VVFHLIQNKKLIILYYFLDYMELEKYISDIIISNNWKNKSRIIGEACEEYVINNVKCNRCNKLNYEKCKANEKSTDLICINCNKKYQVKAKRTTVKKMEKLLIDKIFKTIGGEYSTTLKSIEEDIDYLIILYDEKSYNIYNILYINSECINSSCILPRKPLSSTAKRAGWQGCNIVFNNIHIL